MSPAHLPKGAVSLPAAPSGSIREKQREEGCRVRCNPTPLQGSPLVAKILACGTRCRDSDAPWLMFRGHGKETVNQLASNSDGSSAAPLPSEADARAEMVCAPA